MSKRYKDLPCPNNEVGFTTTPFAGLRLAESEMPLQRHRPLIERSIDDEDLDDERDDAYVARKTPLDQILG